MQRIIPAIRITPKMIEMTHLTKGTGTAEDFLDTITETATHSWLWRFRLRYGLANEIVLNSRIYSTIGSRLVDSMGCIG